MSDAPYDFAKAASDGSQAVGKVSESTGKFFDLIKSFYSPKLKLRQAEADAVYVRTQADAEAYAVLRHAQAEVAANELKAQAAFRLTQTWVRQQENINATVEEAQKYLPSQTPTDDVDPDWVTRFFEGCQDISSPQMQTLFAKLLAGEFARPGTISRKTITLLRDMSTDNANLFRRVASHFWFLSSPKGGGFLPSILIHRDWLGVTYDDVASLDEMGMLSMVQSNVVLKGDMAVACGSRRFFLDFRGQSTVEGFLLTKPAQELFAICGATDMSDEHLDVVLKSIASGGRSELFKPL